jgi:glutaredoxin 3
MSAEVYVKPNCPYCVRAKALLDKRGVEYVEHHVFVESAEQTAANREKLIERVVADTGTTPRTMPQIYLEGEHVGGYDDLVALYAALDAALEDPTEDAE